MKRKPTTFKATLILLLVLGAVTASSAGVDIMPGGGRATVAGTLTGSDVARGLPEYYFSLPSWTFWFLPFPFGF